MRPSSSPVLQERWASQTSQPPRWSVLIRTSCSFCWFLFPLCTIMSCIIENVGMTVAAVPLFCPVRRGHCRGPVWLQAAQVFLVDLFRIRPPLGRTPFVVLEIASEWRSVADRTAGDQSHLQRRQPQIASCRRIRAWSSPKGRTTLIGTPGVFASELKTFSGALPAPAALMRSCPVFRAVSYAA